MRSTALALATAMVLAAGATQVGAQADQRDIPERLDEALRDLLDRVKPTLESVFETLGVLDEIDSPLNYDRPVILPNGDILIPRSADAPEWQSRPPEAERDRRPDGDRRRDWRDLAPDESTRI